MLQNILILGRWRFCKKNRGSQICTKILGSHRFWATRNVELSRPPSRSYCTVPNKICIRISKYLAKFLIIFRGKMRVEGLTIFSKIWRGLNDICRMVNIIWKMYPIVDPSFSYVFIFVHLMSYKMFLLIKTCTVYLISCDLHYIQLILSYM